MALKTVGSAIAELDRFLAEVREKRADSGQGQTTHPIKGVDDQTQVVPEGARSAENTADIKRDVETGGIDAAEEAQAGKESQPVGQTEAKDTGKDPKNETSGAKKQSPDPGGHMGPTSHPIKNVPSSKAANWRVQLREAVKASGHEKVAAELGNSILADISVIFGEKEAEEKPATEEDLKKAAEAGYNTAAVLHASAVEELINQVQPIIKAQLEKEASQDARLLAEYYTAIVKNAEPDVEPKPRTEEDEGEGEAEESVAGEAEGQETLPEGDVAQLAQVAGGAPGGAGGEAMGGSSDEEVLAALAAALQEAGITPEQLIQAIQAEQSGMGGGMGGMGGGMGGMAEMAAGAGAAPEEAKAASIAAKKAAARINDFYKRQKAGQVVKKASIDLTWHMRQLVRQYTGR